MIKINFIKQFMLKKELSELEYKLERHYALSQLKVELENKRGNLLSKLWNQYQYNHVVGEYELLSQKKYLIELRIDELREELQK